MTSLGPWRTASIETLRHVARQHRRGKLKRGSASRDLPRIYGIGAAKTGTHSFGAMFGDRVASGHETDAHLLIRLHLDRARTGDSAPLRAVLRLRDRWRRLKVDASQVNVFLVDDFEALFPDSRYVLTVRPPLEWLRSMTDDSLRRDTDEIWKRFRDHRFGRREGYPEQERPLESAGLYRLDGYLGYWRASIEDPMNRLPPERLLVVRTSDLRPRSAEIADFCGIRGGGVEGAKAHAFANTTRFGVLGRIDAGYLEERTEAICGALTRRLFTDHSIAAAVAALRDQAATAGPAAGRAD